MKLGFISAVFALVLSTAAAYACDSFCFDADEVSKGVVCKVSAKGKDVVVLAKTSADCKVLAGEEAKK